MIKINLCPLDELENRYWMVPDVAVALVVCFAAYFGVDYYMNVIEAEIATVQQESQELKDKYDQLQPDLERFKTLDADINQLKIKIAALKNITVSRISKYRPIIALEHLHNLSPEGVWFKRLAITQEQTFEIEGEAFDNLLLSELIANLRATESQIDDKSDLRTQVFFGKLKLSESTTTKGASAEFPDIQDSPVFKISGIFQERGGSMPMQNNAADEYTQTNAKNDDLKLKQVGM